MGQQQWGNSRNFEKDMENSSGKEGDEWREIYE